MILLGIDPGSRICGYGLIEAQKRVITAVGCDVIDVRNILSLPKRLSAVFDGMESIIESYKPDAAVVESIFYHKNAKSVFTLGQARGVVFLCLGRHDIPVFEYSPREVKKAVVGNGSASKQQVRYMIEQQFKLKGSDKPDDAYDALAIALCHFYKLRYIK
ncbi:MAG TPA: crossover junction endodeoxyribonuclease RuvC [Candidatus Cloacimonadota bacterium]|nr:crossover junction endodeoxyribonuclease RuvC [Candidatus Cloacimonadota bacterium]